MKMQRAAVSLAVAAAGVSGLALGYMAWQSESGVALDTAVGQSSDPATMTKEDRMRLEEERRRSPGGPPVIHTPPPVNDAIMSDEEWLAQSSGIGEAQAEQVGDVDPGTVFRGIVKRRLVVYAGALIDDPSTGGVAVITQPRYREADVPPRYVPAPRSGAGALRILRVADSGEVLVMADDHGELRFSMVSMRFV